MVNDFFRKKILKELNKRGINRITAMEIADTVNSDTYSNCIKQVNYALALICNYNKIQILSK